MSRLGSQEPDSAADTDIELTDHEVEILYEHHKNQNSQNGETDKNGESDENPEDVEDQIEKLDTVKEDPEVKLEVVPRSKRRGLLSNFCLIREVNDSRRLKPFHKKIIVAAVAFAALIAPMGTSIILPAMPDMAKAFKTTESVINVSLGIYLIALGLFPLWWSSFSEINGRRSVYVISFAAFIAFSIGCALCKNIASLFVLRILSGGSAAAVQAVGAGTIGDIFIPQERGRAMGFFYLGPLMGPLLSPIIGGLIVARWGWRSTMWFMVIVGASCFIVIVLVLPETLRIETPVERIESLNDPSAMADLMAPVARTRSRRSQEFGEDEVEKKKYFAKLYKIFRKNADEERKEQRDPFLTKLHITFISPLKSLRLLKYPPVPLTIAYSGLTFMVLYFLNVGIESLYSSPPYGWSSILVGLCYIPNSLGYLISSVSNGYYSDNLIRKSIEKNGRLIPEDRLSYNIYFASTLLPISLLIFGWCAHFKVFWLCPLIGTFLFGIASMLAFGNVATYLVDALPGRGSTGIALNNLFRMILAAIATFVNAPLESAIGYGWLYTMLAFLSILSFLTIVVLKVRGAHFRATYDITSLY